MKPFSVSDMNRRASRRAASHQVDAGISTSPFSRLCPAGTTMNSPPCCRRVPARDKPAAFPPNFRQMRAMPGILSALRKVRLHGELAALVQPPTAQVLLPFGRLDEAVSQRLEARAPGLLQGIG